MRGGDEIGWSGSRAEYAGDGGSSLVHKVCKHFSCERLLDNFSSLLENAHASINLHSVQKAKHILNKFLWKTGFKSGIELPTCMVVLRVLNRSHKAFPAELFGCWSYRRNLPEISTVSMLLKWCSFRYKTQLHIYERKNQLLLFITTHWFQSAWAASVPLPRSPRHRWCWATPPDPGWLCREAHIWTWEAFLQTPDQFYLPSHLKSPFT